MRRLKRIGTFCGSILLVAGAVAVCLSLPPKVRPLKKAPIAGEHVLFWPDHVTRTSTVKETTPSGDSFEFSLTTGPMEKLTNTYASVKHWWGWGSEGPLDPANQSFVLDMTLTLNGANLAIPEKAFVDLLDLRIGRNCFIWRSGDEIYLLLDGSDAGESYDVRMVIRDNKIIRREVRAGEFPEMSPEICEFD